MAEKLFNYVHGLEEPDDAITLLLSQLSCSQTRNDDLEQTFIDAHTIYIRQRCVQLFTEFNKEYLEGTNRHNQSTEAIVMKLLDLIFSCWNTIVYPPRMDVIFEKKPYILEACQIPFAAVVRACTDTDAIVQTLARNSISTSLQSNIRKCGLDVETNAILSIQIPIVAENYINQNFRNHYDSSDLQNIKAWVRNELERDLGIILFNHKDASLSTSRVMDIATQSLCKLRIKELYDIIESENRVGLEELRETMNVPELRNLAVQTFLAECDQNLLSGAADTPELLHSYLRAVKGFSILDPTGVLLERVGKHIRPNLQERGDLSQEIAAGLFGLKSSPLEFLSKIDQTKVAPQKAEAINKAFDNWVPDPLDTPADFVRKQNQDIVFTLLSLIEKKDQLMKNLAYLFKDAVIPKFNKDPLPSESTATESMSLDMPQDSHGSSDDTGLHLQATYSRLTDRLGETGMESIRVMVDDYIRSTKLLSSDSLVVSRAYWPSFSSAKSYTSDCLRWPDDFKQKLKDVEMKFQSEYSETYIGLEWMPEFSYTSLSLHFEDRDLHLTVTTDQAIAISLFDENKSEIKFEDILSNSCFEDEQVLRNLLLFWVHMKVLLYNESDDSYSVLETIEEDNGNHQSIDVDSEYQNNQNKNHEKLQVYWSFIVGMLTNLDKLPVEKIHSFLSFVPSDDPFVQSKQELENYLMAMVDEGKLLYDKQTMHFSLPK